MQRPNEPSPTADGKRLAVWGFALSWFSALPALVVCAVAVRRTEPRTTGRHRAVAGIVAAIVNA
jgi:hypothetical protein